MKTDPVNTFLQKTIDTREHSRGDTYQKVRPRLICVSGLRLSVQASKYHYCAPRIDGDVLYSLVEVGFPPYRIEQLMPYVANADDPTETVYGYVPVEVLKEVIDAHGGLLNGDGICLACFNRGHNDVDCAHQLRVEADQEIQSGSGDDSSP